MEEKKVHILVACPCNARLFMAESFKTQKEMHLVKEFAHPDSRKRGAEVVSDRSGKYSGNSDHTCKSCYDPKHTHREIEAENFATQLAKELNTVCNPHVEDEWIVVAPAHFASLLKKHWHCKFTNFTFIDKDYTKFDGQKLVDMVWGLIF